MQFGSDLSLAPTLTLTLTLTLTEANHDEPNGAGVCSG